MIDTSYICRCRLVGNKATGYHLELIPYFSDDSFKEAAYLDVSFADTAALEILFEQAKNAEKK